MFESEVSTPSSLQSSKIASSFDAFEIAMDRGDFPTRGDYQAGGIHNERVDFALVNIVRLVIVLLTRVLLVQMEGDLNRHQDVMVRLAEGFHHFQLHPTGRDASNLLVPLAMSLADGITFV